jgi:hypothetical protein
MTYASSISEPSLSSSSLERFSTASFEQCAKEILKVCRESLRQYGRVIEEYREVEEREWKIATHRKADTYRSLIPTIITVSSAVLSGLCIGVNLAQRHIGDLAEKIAPDMLKQFYSEPNKLNYLKFAEFINKNLESGQGICKAGQELFHNHLEARRVDFDADIQKAKDLSERRQREASDRRSESDELLRQWQQINREIAESIKLVARG